MPVILAYVAGSAQSTFGPLDFDENEVGADSLLVRTATMAGGTTPYLVTAAYGRTYY